MSRPNYQFNYFSEAEYLEFEEHSLTKHEYFDGEVFSMAGESMNHQILTLPVLEIYQRVENDDMREFLQSHSENKPT